MSTVRTEAARHLALDAATAELVQALAQRGVGSVLLKGPAIARTLYADPTERSYLDVDLLVEPDGWDEAAEVLRGLGYRRWALPPNQPADKAEVWERGDPPTFVDLHPTARWTRADRALVWEAFAAGAERLEVGGAWVAIPGEAARALLLALHACQHGAAEPQPLRDLELGLQHLPAPAWTAASRLAGDLGCADAFVAGLRLAGDERFASAGDRLEVHLHAANAAPMAYGFMDLAALPSLKARLAHLPRRAFPAPLVLRRRYAFARRGRRALAAVYVWRPVWLAWNAPAGVRALHAARRQAGVREAPSLAAAAHPRSIAAALWAWRATGRVRRDLRAKPVDTLRVTPPPSRAVDARRGVGLALRARRASCLESALVRQAWQAAHGRDRDVVVGVTAPAEGFGAHAWLDGERGGEEFGELLRLPVR
jgi:hypothetical protein